METEDISLQVNTVLFVVTPGLPAPDWIRGPGVFL